METKIVKYSNSIYAIDQEMVRAFVIIGAKEALLIDTGVEKVKIMDYIREITQLPVTLCLTHCDRDHIANIDYFKKVYIHKNEVAGFQGQLTRRYDETNERLNIKMMQVEEGHIFNLGDCKLEVIDLPGHTPGSLGLLNREEKYLFSGDTVSYGPVYMFGQSRSSKLYRESLLKVKKMAVDGTISTIFPCHNICPISTDVVDELLSCLEGAENGTIEGKKPQVPMLAEQPILVYQYKDSRILLMER